MISTNQLDFFKTCLFSSHCMKGIAELVSLSVHDLVTIYFSLNLLFAGISLTGNIFLVASFFTHLSAKDNDNLLRLAFKVSRPQSFNELSYDMYLSFNIILNAHFCTLSISSCSPLVIELFQTTADCSRRDLIYNIYIFTRSLIGRENFPSL